MIDLILKKFYFVMAMILLLSLHTVAQTPKVTGIVKDVESGAPIHNAGVEIINDKRVLGKRFTDSLGRYTFLLSILPDKFEVVINATGYEQIKKPIYLNKLEKDKNGDLSVELIALRSKAILLNEVIIRKQKRYRDTVIIDLSKESFKRSIMIDDIFTQKGISKDASGRLYYNGKIVSDVLVNGSNFFGRNNLKIYDKIPALILDNIEVVETTIDSITNTTLLAPTIKMNLKMKEEYQKGKFGSTSGGLGTLKKYIFFTDLYSYKKQEQISFTSGLHNLGLNENSGEPIMNFSSSGNNAKKKSAGFTYRNLYNGKIELNFLTKANEGNILFVSETEQDEQSIKQFSRTKNVSLSNFFEIEDMQLNIYYNVDSVNSIRFDNEFKYNHNKNLDSLRYYIETDFSTSNSLVDRLRTFNNLSINNSIIYGKKFKKAGRLLQAEMKSERLVYNINEKANSSDDLGSSLFDGRKNAVDHQAMISTSFTEPLSDQSYLRINLLYKRENLDYLSRARLNEQEKDLEESNKLNATYLKPGIDFYRTFDDLSLTTTLNGTLNRRRTNIIENLFYLDFDIKATKQASSKKTFVWNYTVSPSYPNISQLINLSNSFDLVSQTNGNMRLKPEVKHNLGFVFDFKKSDSLSLFISAESSYYFNKFGNNINTTPGETQNIFADNVGEAKAAQINFIISKTFLHLGNFDYRLNIGYSELPAIINGSKSSANGTTLRQSLLTSRTLVDKRLSINPNVSITFNKYYYNSYIQKSINMSYSDKISSNILGVEMNLFPFVSLLKTTNNNNLTWGLNSEIRRTIFNKYGIVWIKAYDIFNSFNIRYNNFGPSYIQTVKYSNFSRYFLVGLSVKFNNLK